MSMRGLWIAFIAVLTLTVAAQTFAPAEGHFALEQVFGFHALYGFGACAALILIAKAIGLFLKRRDTYYDG